MRTIFVFIVALLCNPLVRGQETVTNQVEIDKAVVRRAFAALETGDLKTLNELFDPKGPIHTPRGKVILQGGPFTDLKSSCPMCAALSNRKITIDLILGGRRSDSSAIHMEREVFRDSSRHSG
jgi:hypothetical protein